MQLRKLPPRNQSIYIRAVKKLAAYLGHSSESTTREDLRQFQLHLVEQGTSRITINATVTGLRFLFEVTLDRQDVVGKLKTVPVPRKLPVVLCRDEVRRLLEATTSLKYKAAFSVAHGAGLRISEVTALKISDIDSQRMTLPAPISDLAYHNKSVIYTILFKTAAKTLKTIAADPNHLGAKIGFTLVLHTWGSAMTGFCSCKTDIYTVYGKNPSPACARHCTRWWFIHGWKTLGQLQTRFLPVSEGIVSPVPALVSGKAPASLSGGSVEVLR